MRPACRVALGGVWADTVAPVGSVSWTTKWGSGPCGPTSASFTVGLLPSVDVPWLRTGTTVEVYSSSGVRVFGGVLSDASKDFPRQVTADGWPTLAADFDALDSSLEPTTNPRTAVTEAVARGLRWNGGTLTMFDNASLGTDSTPSVTRLPQLLDNAGAATGKRWGTDDRGVPFMAADPVAPSWWLDATDLDIAVADDALYTRVNARYVSATTSGEPSAWDTVTVDDTVAQTPYGVIEYPMDLTDLGLLSSGVVTGYANQQLSQLAIPQWTSRLEVAGQQLLDSMRNAADPQKVKAGQMVHLFNVPANLGGLRSRLGLDVVLGEVAYSDDSPSVVSLAPVNFSARDLASYLKEQHDKATQAAAA